MRDSYKLLPLLIIVSMLSFSVRLSEVVVGVSNLRGTAFAEEAEHSKDEEQVAGEEHQKEEKEDQVMTEDHATDSKMEGHEETEEVEVVSDEKAEQPKWRDANDSSLDVTGVKMELYKDLAERREELDNIEQDLRTREALLKATEQELERKYQELTKLRNEIETLLNQQSEQEESRIKSLVKIYEGMKPKDAARIFDTLDIDVLLSVVAQMSERKVSPIMAAMNPERVRTITIMLAEQKQLPTLR